MMARTTETENSSGGGKLMAQRAPKARWLHWCKHGSSNGQLKNSLKTAIIK